METKIARLEEQMKAIVDKIDSLDKKVDKEFRELKVEMNCFVRKEEFAPIKSIVFGMVGTILTAVVGAILFMIFN